jgi:glycolate oxidase FAD binding subunit
MSESEGSAAYVVDGAAPARVEAPTTDLEAAELLLEARMAGNSVIPVGGGTMLHVGNAPRRYDIALSTTKLRGIIEYSPGDLTVVVRAGTTVAEMQDELARERQFVPLHPALPERATIGGTLAIAMASPWRQTYGAPRDFTIGMRMALPGGQLARSGGKVVKNVAGYDLGKLFIGSYGSLGVITEAAFKVYPLPRERKTIVIHATPDAECFALGRAISGLGVAVLGVAVCESDVAGGTATPSSGKLIVMLGGSRAAVREAATSVQALVARSDARIEHVDGDTVGKLASFSERATLRLTSLPTVAHTTVSETARARSLSYPGVGTSYVICDELDVSQIERARERVAPIGGQVLVLRAPVRVKEVIDVWGSTGPGSGLMRRVKGVFDPDGVMSPGRFVAGL